MDDATLVEAVRSGDGDAWSRLYDRYADRLHDYCWSVLRDEGDAADATHDTFITAMEKLHQLRDPSRLRPWLYSIARRHALARARRRQRMTPAELPEVVDTGVGPAGTAETAELRQLVWSAAEGLSPRDRSVLDLHLRQGLEGAELGEALGTSAANAHVLLSRLRDQVERALGAYLVARTDADCPELQGLLSGWDHSFTPLWRKRIARHVDDCELCGERRRAAVSPLAMLAGVPALAAPASLRQRVLDDLELVSHQRPLMRRQGRRRLMAGAAVIAVAVGGVLAWDAVIDDTGQPTAATSLPTVASTTPSSTTTPSTTVTTVAAGGGGANPTTAPPQATTTTRAAPTTTTTVPDSLTASAATATLATGTGSACPPRTTTVSATTGGDPGPPVLHWTPPGGTPQSRTMTGGPTQWRATLGPFPSPGTVQWYVTAGQLRTGGGTVTVQRCGA